MPGERPCKKRRKDDDRSSCKTITKYLSPIGKTGDRVFSPPKSSNIMDYFRKTSPKNYDYCKKPLDTFSNTVFKKKVKRVNLSQQLNNIKTENESPIEINSDDSKEDCSLNNDFVENSASVLLYNKHVEVLVESIHDVERQSNAMTFKKNSKKVNPKQRMTKGDCKRLGKRKYRDVIDLSESLPLAEELNLLQNSDKDSKETVSSLTNEIESTTNDANSSDHVTETAHLNDCTITVSYEEFLKSHKENKVEQIPDSTMSICLPSETVEEIGTSGYISESENCEISQLMRFKTVTVLAQVHPIPPKRTKKIPPIFLKQKKFEMENSLSDPENEQTIQKRKSNVVIQEEELELAVLEAGSSEAVKPKCTLEERQQFMKAFRQPASDAIKNGVKKSSDKQKDLNEKYLNEEGRDNNSKKIMENPNIQMDSNGSSQSHADRRSFPMEKSKMLKKKNKETLDTGATTGENQKENNQKKETILSLRSKQNQNRFRMSLRHKKSEIFKSTTLLNSENLVCEGIANDDPLMISSLCDKNKSSRKTSTSIKEKIIYPKAEPEDRLVNVSTPKSSRRSIRNSSTPTTIRGPDYEDVQDNSPVKFSTPQTASVSENFVFISNPTSLKTSEKNQKKLQCLNDVLGKKLDKSPKNVPGKMKVAPLFIARKVPKTADPDIGLEESSQDTSEKSQDCDVQFKAKRDFLMSGLPDLLKRQIAKKAAVLDVYNSLSTSFQKVVHIQQKDDGCWLWNLKLPSCPLLTTFKESNTKVIDLSKCVIALGEFSTLNSNSKSNSAVMTRKNFTKEVRNLLLEEIRWSNPEFSLGKYFPLLLKKQIEHQALSEYHGKQENPQVELDNNQKESKRKRVEIENQKSKRKKPNEYSVSPVKINGKPEELDKRNNSFEKKLGSSKGIFSKMSRKKQTALSTPRKVKTGAVEDNDILIIDGDKEFPAEISSISDLSDSKDFKGSSDDEEESRLCNTVLITGPTGVGKTAAVYACAQELGFKIFEVNASSQRSGRQILSQLKEATQSHQVDKQGVNSQKPCFFNSYNIGKSPKKLNSPKKVVTSPRKLPPSSPKSNGQKRGIPPKTLANYFKVSSKSKNNEEIELLESNKGIKNSLEQKQITQTKSASVPNSNVKEFGAEESNRKNATSLILFEEVDVIFDEDAGFLNAIKTFMTTTKRPVILTTSDPTFSLLFDGCFEEINFSTPSLLNVATYLQMICLTENFRTDVKDFVTLLTANGCDIRKSILYLQFWIRSGGGFLEERPLSHCRNSRNEQLACSEDGPASKNNTRNTKSNHVDLPKCDTGCVETLFGLKNIFSPSEDLFSFLKHKITTKEEWHKLIQLLTEFHMRDVDFLYSNLEFILPLPVDIIPESKNICGSSINVDASAARSMKCLARKCTEGERPLNKSQKKKHKKKIVTLDDSDLFDNDLDFSEFINLSPASSSNLEENKTRDSSSGTKNLNNSLESSIESIPHPPKTPAGKKSSVLVSHCLNSLTEFMDNMSFLDALLTDIKEQKELGKNDFRWTDGMVKSGLCDEFSLESNDGRTSQSSRELKATAEALTFIKCSSTISKALESSLNSCKKLGRDPTKDLTFSVSQKHNNVCFSQSATDLDSAWKRISVIKSVFSSRSLLNLGNRQASVIEYLPVLRNICRTEKLKEQGKSKRRFLHYFEGIHLDIPKETVNTLAAEFP
uniref:ATPase family AAA domain containing 5 n=1 Tax=Spermophilus dauricus TaxID=99837 RepID=A0A8C9QSE4_SPEDA